jgi:hypothetical protein
MCCQLVFFILDNIGKIPFYGLLKSMLSLCAMGFIADAAGEGQASVGVYK